MAEEKTQQRKNSHQHSNHLKKIYFRLFMPAKLVQVTDTTDDSAQPSVRKYTVVSKECSFTIGKTLRHNTFGKVKLATPAVGNTRLAVKIVHKGHSESKPYIQVVLPREVALMKMLNGHPNTVKFLSVVHSDNYIILAMEHVEGPNLLDYVASKKSLDEMEAKRIFRDLLNGVSVCHSMGIAIRGLSCENILLDSGNRPKISNFEHGFVQGYDTLDLFDGSPPPDSAPEVSQGKEYSHKAVDVWSLGVILYTMVMGIIDKQQDWSQLEYSPLPFPDDSSISVVCMNLIQRMTHLSPEERPTISEVKEDQWVNDPTLTYAYDSSSPEDPTHESLKKDRRRSTVTSTTQTVDSVESYSE